MIDGKNFFDLPVKSDMRTYDNIWKISTDQGDGYMTGCLLDYNNSKEHCKMIAVDLNKQQELDSDSKATQQINFTGSLENQWTIIFIMKRLKK